MCVCRCGDVARVCVQVEMLYQRYFLRMNQTNMTHLLGLLLAVAVGLLVVQVRTLLLAQNLLSKYQPMLNMTDDFKYVIQLYFIIIFYIFFRYARF